MKKFKNELKLKIIEEIKNSFICEKILITMVKMDY
jgi:hypothetical protein